MTAKSETQPGIKLVASVTRNYGAISATFGAEIIIATGTAESTLSGYAVLLDMINDQFRHYESVNLPQENANPAIYDKKGAPETFQTVDCVKMHVDTYKGKTVYKITGGRWLKFGVPIYEEVLSKYRDVANLKVGTEYNMAGWKMKVDNAVNPKVVSLIAPA